MRSPRFWLTVSHRSGFERIRTLHVDDYRDGILWLVTVLIALACIIKMSNMRRKHLHGLLKEYIARQVLWVRRKMKAAELKNKKSES